jgi:peptide/nickel transport system substrate-binding protein
MISKKTKIVTLVIATMMTFTTLLSGCKNTTKTDTPSDVSANKVKPANPVNNKDKVFRAVGGWPKPPLYNGNNWGGGVGPAFDWTYEGLFMTIRSTEKIYNWLAEDYKDEGNKTTVTLKKGVKWSDGQPYTSKDVWAFYILNMGTDLTKYLTDIETPDDNTVVFIWQEPAPYSELRKKLIASEVQGAIAYHQYKKYVDKHAEILKQCKKLTDPNKKGPYGLDTDALNVKEQFDANWNAFVKSGPEKPLGTGPFKLETVTATDMVLVKNDLYRDKENINFDKLMFKQVPDLAGQYALLKSGQLDYFNGTQAKDILENMLASNKDLVHYRAFDPASVGMLFNIRKKPFDNLKFRQAITYILDKKKIREVGNYYGTEFPEFSAVGIVPSRLNEVLLPEVKAKMTNYTNNHKKAEELLKEIGWNKGSDGIWVDENGKKYEFIIASAQSEVERISGGQVVADQLTKFGLPTKLKSVDGSVYYSNADKGEYDMSTEWVDTNWGFSDDWNTLRNAYWWGPKPKIGFPTKKVKNDKGEVVDIGKLDLQLPGADGKVIDVEDTLASIPTILDEKERKKKINDLIYIYNENCWAVNWYQNTTGTWMNSKTIDGKYPMESEWKKYDRDLPLPTKPEDILGTAELNIGFSSRTTITSGRYWPK